VKFVLIGDSHCDAQLWVDLVFRGQARNLCFAGSTTSDWVNTSDEWLQQAGPGQTWLVLLGTNEAASASHDLYAANLELIVSSLERAGANVQLVQSPPAYVVEPEVTPALHVQETIDLEICASHPQVECGPNLFSLLGRRHLLEDGVHLSAVGNRTVAAEIGLTLGLDPIPLREDIAGMLALPLLVAVVAMVIFAMLRLGTVQRSR
jgi:hypothetical protein